MARKKFKQGDKVTCLYPVWSNNGQALFEPGMVGTVRGVFPKVCIWSHADPRYYDKRKEYVSVEFVDNRGLQSVCSLNFVNVRAIEDEQTKSQQ